MKDKILDLFINKNMKQNEIAKELNVSNSKVSRILKNIPEVEQEKDKRKKQNPQNKLKLITQLFNSYVGGCINE